ncbi:hypothetical protein F5888DRAFT_672716 [Russula emetica]|nr:hypothetical protein F5888DRAFT_672716 [Russula emetica]
MYCGALPDYSTAQRRSTDRRGLTGGTSQCIYGTDQLILCASSLLLCPFGSCLQRRRASSFTISSILPVYSTPKLSSTPNACLTHCAIPIRVSCLIPHKCDECESSSVVIILPAILIDLLRVSYSTRDSRILLAYTYLILLAQCDIYILYIIRT